MFSIEARLSESLKLPFLGLSGSDMRLTICLMFISPSGICRR